MDDKRKATIVNEILYWKESRMLPEQYCDYLLALYTEGNQPDEPSKKNTGNKIQLLYFLFITLIPLSVIFLYFIELSFDLQMVLSSILLIASIVLSIYFFNKGIIFPLALIVSAFTLLFTSVEFASYYFMDQFAIQYSVVILNCMIWLIIGWKLKLIYFTLSGILGLGLLVVSLFI